MGRREAMFPAEPPRMDSVTDELPLWLRGHREMVELMTFARDIFRVVAFERHGLRHRRSSFVLARPDDPGPLPAAAFPGWVRVAPPYRLGDDDQALHQLKYVDAAWASVPGHAERDLDESRQIARRLPITVRCSP